MAKFSSTYKQTGPTRRIIQGENSYEKGMYWTNSAVDQGYVHTLLNYELDQLNYTAHVAGGLHVTDIASGSSFLDRATFGESSSNIIVLQSRNEYNLRAFEGITNIISANRLTIKNNQTLEEKLRQQGFTADDVVCYKLLTYNPFNHRLMSVTLIQAKRDKYFVLEDGCNLRRLNSNPISCGFSEVWENGTENYVSNKLDYHLSGASDNFIPRARRNSYDETFGQKLHSSAFMQTVPNCEGYGNKTFCFTKRKQVAIEGVIKDTTTITYKTVTKVADYRFGGFAQIILSNGIATILPGQDYAVGDIITVQPKDEAKRITPMQWKVTKVHDYTLDDVKYTNGILEVDLISSGVFEGTSDNFTTKYSLVMTTSGSGSGASYLLAFTEEQIIDSELKPDVTTEDIYFKHINTGITGIYNALLDQKQVPVDAFRFGIVLTSCALTRASQEISTDSAVNANDPMQLWDTALVDVVKANESTPLFKLNLTNGALTPNVGNEPISIKLQALPYIDRGIDGAPTSVFNPTDVFSNGGLIEDWGSSPNSVHPSTWLKDSIKNTLRKGQGFRFAAYCTSEKNPARYLNTLREDPLASKYYDTEIEAVFVLDYVWNGTEWEFSFVDTSIDMVNNDTLVENWESNANDELGNRITRHYVWLNSLAYTDVLTEDNLANMAKHLVDGYNAPKILYNTATGVVFTGTNVSLAQDLDDTIDNNLPSNIDLINKSKLNDISYGHFEVTPKSLAPGEAALWGYNMLSNTPYTFECVNMPGTQTASITGVLLKNKTNRNKVLLKPVVNTPGVLEIYYQSDYSYLSSASSSSQTLQLQIEYKNPNDEWRKLKDYTRAETHALLSTGTPVQIDFTGADETTLIRVTLRDTDPDTAITVPTADGSGTETTYLVVSQLITTLAYTKDATKAEPSPEIYDLGSATGITYWKGRLVLWGVLNAENMLFMSEPNEPEYFAYPNGVDILEENIVHVLPYSDALIVFTSTKLWRIDLNTDGLSWTKTLLQQNLRINDNDVPYITVLKNMLFFKSGKQFYMLVPSKTSTIGELTIAPISKAIAGMLENPFAAIRDIVHTIYPDLAGSKYASPLTGATDPEGKLINIPDKPITDYLVKYGVHTEQNRVMVDWWFDMSDWKAQKDSYSDRAIQHDVTVQEDPDNSATCLNKEYWLVQLIYDAETYGWTMRTHTTNAIGVFIADAVNADTDFINLVFNPEDPIFDGNAKATWGVAISHRRQPADYSIQEFNLRDAPNIKILSPDYPRFQVFDTGYKEVSSPSLKKRFREIQLNFEPSSDTEEGLRSAFMASIDGYTVMSAVSQEIFEETETDPITGTSTIIKVVDRINFHDDALLDPNTPANYVPLPYLVDGELSNTFVLDSSALAGVKHVKIRRQINGKGYLARMRFVNITHANYALTNYAFVYHNKNAR